tara:strand:- start:3903 stop:4256 length:354 start_codon:yes stop_codon:yes gene_type:complete
MILTNVSQKTLMIMLPEKKTLTIKVGETIDSSKLPSGENHYFVKKQWLAQNDLSKSVSCEQENNELKDKNIKLEQEVTQLKAQLANAKKRKSRRKPRDSDEEETQESESETEEQVNE